MSDLGNRNDCCRSCPSRADLCLSREEDKASRRPSVEQEAVAALQDLPAVLGVHRGNGSRRPLFAVRLSRPDYGLTVALAKRFERRLAAQPVIAIGEEDRLHPGIVVTERVQHFF